MLVRAKTLEYRRFLDCILQLIRGEALDEDLCMGPGSVDWVPDFGLGLGLGLELERLFWGRLSVQFESTAMTCHMCCWLQPGYIEPCNITRAAVGQSRISVVTLATHIVPYIEMSGLR